MGKQYNKVIRGGKVSYEIKRGYHIEQLDPTPEQHPRDKYTVYERDLDSKNRVIINSLIIELKEKGYTKEQVKKALKAKLAGSIYEGKIEAWVEHEYAVEERSEDNINRGSLHRIRNKTFEEEEEER